MFGDLDWPLNASIKSGVALTQLHLHMKYIATELNSSGLVGPKKTADTDTEHGRTAANGPIEGQL